MRLSLLLFTFMLAACSTAPSSETAAYPTRTSDNRPMPDNAPPRQRN